MAQMVPAAIAGPSREMRPSKGHWTGQVMPTTPTGSQAS